MQKWLKEHQTAIKDLEEGSRALYDEVRSLAAEPELIPLMYPATIQGKQADKNWDKHLYVDDVGEYADIFNKPETEMLEQELERKDVVAWLRNVDRKAWSLCIPYEVDGQPRAMYPDFLLVRKEGKQLVIDILDPHSIALADAPAKAAGLAKFAAQHADEFGRIDLILLDGKSWKRISLADETVREKVRGVKLSDQMKKLFDEA